MEKVVFFLGGGGRGKGGLVAADFGGEGGGVYEGGYWVFFW